MIIMPYKDKNKQKRYYREYSRRVHRTDERQRWLKQWYAKKWAEPDWRSKRLARGATYRAKRQVAYKRYRWLSAWRQRFKVLIKLGGLRCVKCGQKDIRVLEINHLNGRANKDRRSKSMWYNTILKDDYNVAELEVRCASCNILYEYECGRRKIPKEILDASRRMEKELDSTTD